MIEFYILKRKYDWSIAEELIYSGDKNDKAEIKRRRDICIKLEHQASLWSKARYSDSISAGFDAEDLLWKKFMKPYI